MLAAKGERLVALFEATKGVLVLLLGFGLLSVVHRDVQWVAGELLSTFHINPAHRFPRIFLDAAERFSDVRLWLIAALALSYAVLRLAEAYGLWFGRRWAEWLAVASGGIYIPIEINGIVEKLSWVRVGTLVLNIIVVAYIGWALWKKRTAATDGPTSAADARGGASAKTEKDTEKGEAARK
jgi:uncharacterized membrane protein (DUF2068 family)